MAIRNLRYDGDMILYKKSRDVEIFDESIEQIVSDMFETMYKYNGVGLAAPQVGILKRILVIDTGEEGQKLEMINPKITKLEKEVILSEGCLSFPNKFALVDRPIEVTVKALNENGDEIKIKAKELLAQALCHEINHLDGVLFVDLMEPGTMEYIDPNNKK